VAVIGLLRFSGNLIDCIYSAFNRRVRPSIFNVAAQPVYPPAAAQRDKDFVGGTAVCMWCRVLQL
jgi:hypothetical protein